MKSENRPLLITLLAIGSFAVGIFLYSVVASSDETLTIDSIDTNAASISFTETEVGFDDVPNPLDSYTIGRGQYTLEELRTWNRPEGPLRVGVQIGHYENDDAPDELAGIRNNGGAAWGPYTEQDVVEPISRLIAEQLEGSELDIVVDILPAVVPPGYVADAFVSIHADGNTSETPRGYKFAAPRRDYSGHSDTLVAALYEQYGALVPMPEDPSISRRMSAYYAFNWARYEHAIHPYTPAAIVELGFLTNAADRTLMLEQPTLLASAVTAAIEQFLRETADTPQPAPPESLTTPVVPLSGTFACAPLRTERLNQADRYGCEPSIITTAGLAYALRDTDPAMYPEDTPITVTGQYTPVQVLDNYFWFPYEINGFFSNPVIETNTI